MAVVFVSTGTSFPAPSCPIAGLCAASGFDPDAGFLPFQEFDCLGQSVVMYCMDRAAYHEARCTWPSVTLDAYQPPRVYEGPPMPCHETLLQVLMFGGTLLRESN